MRHRTPWQILYVAADPKAIMTILCCGGNKKVSLRRTFSKFRLLDKPGGTIITEHDEGIVVGGKRLLTRRRVRRLS